MIGESKAVLRPLTEQDMQVMEQWKSYDEASSQWYQKMLRGRNCKIFAITTREGRLIGDIGLAEISWRGGDAELSIRIGQESDWNKGYGMEAVMALLELAFSEMKLKRIYLRVHKANTRAIRCYEKCGFKKEGVVERRLDGNSRVEKVFLMSILRDEFMSLPGRIGVGPLRKIS
ncbi:MAG TPA: GNAT family N-acetyltransferase [Firmicutes bacterium]|nr:GNAT family N-acetyltransferase [Bacillota bacterium]